MKKTVGNCDPPRGSNQSLYQNGRPFAVALIGAEGWGGLMSAVDFRHMRGERANTASRCLVQSWEQARGRGVLAYLEGAVGVLDLVAGAPPGNKGAGQRGIVEVDRLASFRTPCRPAGAIAQPLAPQFAPI
jgi:hypothetical protein